MHIYPFFLTCIQLPPAQGEMVMV